MGPTIHCNFVHNLLKENGFLRVHDRYAPGLERGVLDGGLEEVDPTHTPVYEQGVFHLCIWTLLRTSQCSLAILVGENSGRVN